MSDEKGNKTNHPTTSFLTSALLMNTVLYNSNISRNNLIQQTTHFQLYVYGNVCVNISD